MPSRFTVMVAFLVVTLLAGCAGLTWADDAPEDVDLPPAYETEGVIDAEVAVDQYESTLIDHGSYVGEYVYNIDEGTANETTVAVAYHVDFEAETALRTVSLDGPTSSSRIETYYGDGQSATRYTTDGESGDVLTDDEAFPTNDLTAVEAIQPLLEAETAYETSVEERDGVGVVVFRTTDVEESATFVGVDDLDEITHVEGTVAVDADGLVREAHLELRYVFEGEERSLRLTFELDDVGSATVDRPAWADA